MDTGNSMNGNGVQGPANAAEAGAMILDELKTPVKGALEASGAQMSVGIRAIDVLWNPGQLMIVYQLDPLKEHEAQTVQDLARTLARLIRLAINKSYLPSGEPPRVQGVFMPPEHPGPVLQGSAEPVGEYPAEAEKYAPKPDDRVDPVGCE